MFHIIIRCLYLFIVFSTCLNGAACLLSIVVFSCSVLFNNRFAANASLHLCHSVLGSTRMFCLLFCFAVFSHWKSDVRPSVTNDRPMTLSFAAKCIHAHRAKQLLVLNILLHSSHPPAQLLYHALTTYQTSAFGLCLDFPNTGRDRIYIYISVYIPGST